MGRAPPISSVEESCKYGSAATRPARASPAGSMVASPGSRCRRSRRTRSTSCAASPPCRRPPTEWRPAQANGPASPSRSRLVPVAARTGSTAARHPHCPAAGASEEVAMTAQHARPLQAAPAPATMAPATIRTIAVPLDGSPLAEQALPYAVTLARATRASLVLAWLAPASARAAVYGPAAWAWGRREPAAYLRQLAPELTQGGLE